MKKSAKVTLTFVAALGLAGCRRTDPCDQATFNEQACQQAIRDGGYYYADHWHPMFYSHPYPYYYDNYRRYVSSGGASHGFSSSRYARPSGSVARGGFGSIGRGVGG